MATTYDEALEVCRTFRKKSDNLWQKEHQLGVEAAKYNNSYVIDENLSIKENRIQVEALRDKTLAQKQQARDAKRKLDEDTAATIMAYIASEFNLNLVQARFVYARAYDDGHSSGFEEVLTDANEYGSFARDILDSQA